MSSARIVLVLDIGKNVAKLAREDIRIIVMKVNSRKCTPNIVSAHASHAGVIREEKFFS